MDEAAALLVVIARAADGLEPMSLFYSVEIGIREQRPCQPISEISPRFWRQG